MTLLKHDTMLVQYKLWLYAIHPSVRPPQVRMAKVESRKQRRTIA